MRIIPATLFVIQLAGLCACANPELAAHPTGLEQPARISKPSPEAQAELLRAVNTALHTSGVTLADDALTTTDSLIIERVPARDASGQRLSGRDFDRPQHFLLVKADRECVLVHQESGQRFPLKDVDCEGLSK